MSEYEDFDIMIEFNRSDVAILHRKLLYYSWRLFQWMSLIELQWVQRSKDVCREQEHTVHAQFLVAEIAESCYEAWIKDACFKHAKIENYFDWDLFERWKSVECRAMIEKRDLFVALFTSLCFCKSFSRLNFRWRNVDFFDYKHDCDWRSKEEALTCWVKYRWEDFCIYTWKRYVLESKDNHHILRFSDIRVYKVFLASTSSLSFFSLSQWRIHVDVFSYFELLSSSQHVAC